MKAAKVPKVKRPGTAYALFVKEKYSSISDTLPASDRSVALVRPRPNFLGIRNPAVHAGPRPYSSSSSTLASELPQQRARGRSLNRGCP